MAAVTAAPAANSPSDHPASLTRRSPRPTVATTSGVAMPLSERAESSSPALSRETPSPLAMAGRKGNTNRNVVLTTRRVAVR